MKDSLPASRRLDAFAFEMIFVVALITLHDFLLSDALSLPLALQRSTLAELKALDRIVSSAEFVVPIVFIGVMLLLWLIKRNEWVHRLALVFLAWVTLRLISKVGLVLYSIITRPLKQGTGILGDAMVLWLAIVFLFGIWYWLIDGGGPLTRRDNQTRRFDFGFPQQAAAYPGWEAWRPGFWDYIFLGFCGST